MNMRHIRHLILLTLLWLAASVAAENYPYRSDVLWVTVPDHADWLYQTGEKAEVEVLVFLYGVLQDGLEVHYELGPDMMPSDKSGKVTLRNGRAVIDVGTMSEPGFRDCKLSATIGGKTYSHHIKLGFSPEKLEAYTQMPSDFQDFWRSNIEEAEKFPLTYSIEPAEEYATDKVECYLVRLQLNKRGQCVYGYLFIPGDAQEGGCPVVLCPPGAGVKAITNVTRRRFYAEEGCIRMEIDIHGLNPRMPAEQFKEVSNALSSGANEYLMNGLDNRDNYYMKRAYLACLRSLDFLTSLPEWDGKNVVVQGSSQGGALALITAGLDKRVTACIANHPALSDMARYKSGRAGGYPHFFRTPGMDTPEKLNTMAYYDVVNFARLITCPVRMSWGFNDNTCPPTTSYIVYNLLTCQKECLLTPVNEHWTSDETERSHFEWLKKQLK